MGYAFSLFLVAVGAILQYAVTGSVEGVDLDVVGVILMVLGIIGLIVTFGTHLLIHDEYAERPTNVVEDDPLRPVRRRKWYR